MNDSATLSPSCLREGSGEGLPVPRHPRWTSPPPGPLPQAGGEVNRDWTRAEIAALFDLPFDDLMFQAQTVHRAHHAHGQVQFCTLLSIKTGGCPEDCGYCNQSQSADTDLKATKLMDVRAVLQSAAQAKDAGSQRFCMGAAWAQPQGTATCPPSSRWCGVCGRWV